MTIHLYNNWLPTCKALWDRLLWSR